MNNKESKIIQGQKELVLMRFKTLNRNSKILLGSGKEVTVGELINHIEKGDDFGEKVVKAQIKMLQVLSGAQ